MVTHQIGAAHHFRTRHAQLIEANTVMLVFSSPCFSAGTFPRQGDGHDVITSTTTTHGLLLLLRNLEKTASNDEALSWARVLEHACQVAYNQPGAHL
jgi:hypothetical protein